MTARPSSVLASIVVVLAGCQPVRHTASITGVTSRASGSVADVLAGVGELAGPKDWYFPQVLIGLDQPLTLDRIEVDFCAPTAFTRGSIYAPGLGSLTLKLPDGSTGGVARTLVATSPRGTVTGGGSAEPMQLNLYGPDLCVRAIRFFDGKERVLVSGPRVAGANAVASATVEPVEANGVGKLFDSRLNTAWLAPSPGVGASLTFELDQAAAITSLTLWNGDQRGDEPFWAASRIKKLRLTGDGGYDATMSVGDHPGRQNLELPARFQGKSLRLDVLEVYPGVKRRDLVVAELRFVTSEGEPLVFAPLTEREKLARVLRDRFEQAGLGLLLDNATTAAVCVVAPRGEGLCSLTVASDGSMDLSGTRPGRPGACDQDRFTARGTFEVVKVAPGQLDLRFSGTIDRKRLDLLTCEPVEIVQRAPFEQLLRIRHGTPGIILESVSSPSGAGAKRPLPVVQVML